MLAKPTDKNIARFTLLELMVGMTVLSILMLMLLQFLISSQRTLDWSDRMWRIYENSRIVFDLVERDLQACVTSSTPDDEIPFYIGAPDVTDTNKALHMCFVASIVPPNDNATSRLCEISYRFHESTAPEIAGNSSLTLYRRIITNVDGPDWNFQSSPTWYTNDDVNTDGDYQKVVGGIRNFSVQFFYDAATAITVPTGGIDTTVKPTSVRITFDLFDESLSDAPAAVQAKTLRGFYKDIDLKKF